MHLCLFLLLHHWQNLFSSLCIPPIIHSFILYLPHSHCINPSLLTRGPKPLPPVFSTLSTVSIHSHIDGHILFLFQICCKDRFLPFFLFSVGNDRILPLPINQRLRLDKLRSEEESWFFLLLRFTEGGNSRVKQLLEPVCQFFTGNWSLNILLRLNVVWEVLDVAGITFRNIQPPTNTFQYVCG